MTDGVAELILLAINAINGWFEYGFVIEWFVVGQDYDPPASYTPTMALPMLGNAAGTAPCNIVWILMMTPTKYMLPYTFGLLAQ